MDGVILDSEKVYRMHWIQAGAEFGLSKSIMEPICDQVAGGTSDHTRQVYLEALGKDFPYDALRARTYQLMDAYIQENGLERKPGVIELLTFLKRKNIGTALATSTARERATRNLERAGILSYFDHLVFGDSIQRGKPYPDIYLKACEELGTSPEETMGVEDSINGIIASSTGGLFTVMVVDLIQPTQEVREKANRIYKSLFDIIDNWEEE